MHFGILLSCCCHFGALAACHAVVILFSSWSMLVILLSFCCHCVVILAHWMIAMLLSSCCHFGASWSLCCHFVVMLLSFGALDDWHVVGIVLRMLVHVGHFVVILLWFVVIVVH